METLCVNVPSDTAVSLRQAYRQLFTRTLTCLNHGVFSDFLPRTFFALELPRTTEFKLHLRQ